MTSSTVTINAGACQYLQVWTPPGKHQIIQLKVAAAPAAAAPPPGSVVVSPGASLLTPGQQAQLTANNTVYLGEFQSQHRDR